MANEKVAEEALFPAISMPLLSGGRASIPLLSLGFITRKPFEQRIENLRAYKEKHGHVNVKKSDDKSLFTFRRDIRYARKHPEKSNTVLTDDRIASLDALGFDWGRNSDITSAPAASSYNDNASVDTSEFSLQYMYGGHNPPTQGFLRSSPPGSIRERPQGGRTPMGGNENGQLDGLDEEDDEDNNNDILQQEEGQQVQEVEVAGLNVLLDQAADDTIQQVVEGEDLIQQQALQDIQAELEQFQIQEENNAMQYDSADDQQDYQQNVLNLQLQIYNFLPIKSLS